MRSSIGSSILSGQGRFAAGEGNVSYGVANFFKLDR